LIVWIFWGTISENAGNFLHWTKHVAAIQLHCFNPVGIAWLIPFSELGVIRIDIFEAVCLPCLAESLSSLTVSSLPILTGGGVATPRVAQGCSEGADI